ncbi:MAG TPA: DUF6390 family protein [Ktedonobacterales bacterium]
MRAAIAVETMDSCRISWGEVIGIAGPELVVACPRLLLREGKLALGEAEPMRVTRQIDGQGFADDAKPGDMVSVHWNWTCETLNRAKVERLKRYTQRHIAIAIANEAI